MRGEGLKDVEARRGGVKEGEDAGGGDVEGCLKELGDRKCIGDGALEIFKGGGRGFVGVSIYADYEGVEVETGG